MTSITIGIWQPVQAANHGGAAAQVKEDFVAARVLAVEQPAVDQQLLNKTGIISRHQNVRVTILEGALAGKTVVVSNDMTDNPAYNISVKPGQELILSVVTDGGGPAEFNISDYRRTPALTWLLGVFLIVFLVLGGKQGLKSLAGLLVCVALIALVLLPLSLRGFNPLLTAVAICLGATTSSMFFVAGFSRKAWSAVLGTVGGVVIAGLAAHLVIQSAPLTGLSSEEAQILRGSVLVQPPQFYSGLLTAGMLIGALGVIMDVGISIASSVFEVSRVDSSLSVKQLYQAGMNVGRDIMGTMTNTLVLAYTGSALPLLMLVAHMPSIKLLNLDLVATELTAALTGSLGLICTIPLTALAAAKLMARPVSPFKNWDALHDGSNPETNLELATRTVTTANAVINQLGKQDTKPVYKSHNSTESQVP